MAQNAVGQILPATERVDDLTVAVFGHRIDGEVAPHQILLKRYAFIGVKTETGIAFGGFALGAGEGVFFLAFGVQEYGKIGADRLITGGQHGIGIGADHHPVAVFHR